MDANTTSLIANKFGEFYKKKIAIAKFSKRDGWKLG